MQLVVTANLSKKRKKDKEESYLATPYIAVTNLKLFLSQSLMQIHL